MKVQIAFDSLDLDQSITTAIKIAPFCDIIEIGSLLIYKYGINAIETFRLHLPKKTILADSKIVDRGKDAATLILTAGADWLTVMAGTNKDVIHDVCNQAHSLNKKVMLDLIDSASPGQSALDAKSLGVDAILFKQVFDENQPEIFMDKWDMVKNNTDLPIFISSKIKRSNIEKIISLKPDGIILGKSVVQAENPESEAEFFYNLCK